VRNGKAPGQGLVIPAAARSTPRAACRPWGVRAYLAVFDFVNRRQSEGVTRKIGPRPFRPLGNIGLVSP
jgi:hypothetical protein